MISTTNDINIAFDHVLNSLMDTSTMPIYDTQEQCDECDETICTSTTTYNSPVVEYDDVYMYVTIGGETRKYLKH